MDQTKNLGGTSDLFLTLDILTYCPLSSSSRDLLTACFLGYQHQSPRDPWKHFHCVLRAKPPGRGLALLISTFVFWASCLVVRQCSWAVKTWIWELDRPEFECWPSSPGQESMATWLAWLLLGLRWLPMRECRQRCVSCISSVDMCMTMAAALLWLLIWPSVWPWGHLPSHWILTAGVLSTSNLET